MPMTEAYVVMWLVTLKTMPKQGVQIRMAIKARERKATEAGTPFFSAGAPVFIAAAVVASSSP